MKKKNIWTVFLTPGIDSRERVYEMYRVNLEICSENCKFWNLRENCIIGVQLLEGPRGFVPLSPSFFSVLYPTTRLSALRPRMSLDWNANQLIFVRDTSWRLSVIFILHLKTEKNTKARLEEKATLLFFCWKSIKNIWRVSIISWVTSRIKILKSLAGPILERISGQLLYAACKFSTKIFFALCSQ